MMLNLRKIDNVEKTISVSNIFRTYVSSKIQSSNDIITFCNMSLYDRMVVQTLVLLDGGLSCRKNGNGYSMR
jgi:hypothetical protein